jgi:formylglycine-generating enzyme required for sulfatase activity
MPNITPVSHEPPPAYTGTPHTWITPCPPVSGALPLPPLAGIPGGSAWIGYNHGFPDEAPAHVVYVPPFAIGVCPVTNRDYAAFLADACTPSPCYWNDARLNQDNQPVVGVTWSAAQAYCRWLTAGMRAAGMLPPGQIVRLPTEPEWEKAASWDPALQRARRYPWGDHWDSARAVTAATGTEFPVSVAEHPGGASVYGVHGMLGNVWEWTASMYMSYPGARKPFVEPNHYVIRGGSCTLRPTHLRCSYRCRLPPYSWRYHLGFRVVVGTPLGAET